jgi:hypothetical protein
MQKLISNIFKQLDETLNWNRSRNLEMLKMGQFQEKGKGLLPIVLF